MAADCLEHVEVIARVTGSRLTAGAILYDIDTPYFCVFDVPPQQAQPRTSYHLQTTPDIDGISHFTRRFSTPLSRTSYCHVCGFITVLFRPLACEGRKN